MIDFSEIDEITKKHFADGAKEIREMDGPLTKLFFRRVVLTDKRGYEMPMDKGERIEFGRTGR